MVEALSLRDVELRARQLLDGAVYDFFAGGAGDEVTVRANEAAFARIGLLPRVLRGVADRSLEVDLLGSRTRMPVLIAPTAFHRLAHPDGEGATARAAAAAGVIMIVSMASTTAIEDIAKAAAGVGACQLWLQLYLQPDLGFTEALVHRAEAAGCSAIVVTVDSPVFGRRERDLRNGFADLPGGLCCEHLRSADGTVRHIEFRADLSWPHVEWLRGVTGLPIVVKGVVHPADALTALEHGVDAVVVSNHGGRQLDTVPAAVELLPAIAAATGGRLPLLLDGGIRRGTDVVKALALGASAVGIGRPVLWALACGGERGVAQVLDLLRVEVDQAMALCGCRSPAEIGPDLVRLP